MKELDFDRWLDEVRRLIDEQTGWDLDDLAAGMDDYRRWYAMGQSAELTAHEVIAWLRFSDMGVRWWG